MKNFLNHSMNISNFQINYQHQHATCSSTQNSIFVPKFTQTRTEKNLSNNNQQTYGTTLNKYYKSIYCSKPLQKKLFSEHFFNNY